MDDGKYLRDRAAEMTDFVLTAPEPASSEFFKLAAQGVPMKRNAEARVRDEDRDHAGLVTVAAPRHGI
jgi:hypothetical protein